MLTLAAWTLLLPASASAQEPFGIDARSSGPPASEGTEQAVVARYWELGRPRIFGGMILEAGFAYAKPKFSVGYGQPYWKWVGLEADPIVSTGGLGHYAGIAAVYPGISLRVGARYSYPFERSLLLKKESYDRTDLSLDGPRASYLAFKGEVATTVPIWGGSLFGIGTVLRTEGVPDGFLLFEESLRVIIDPPWVWRVRMGYLLSFSKNGAIRMGPAVDYVRMPERNENILRAGVLGSVLINAHLEAQASLIPVIVSPDSLGLAGGDFGQLGIRFRWATGSTPDPHRVRQWRQRQPPRGDASPER